MSHSQRSPVAPRATLHAPGRTGRHHEPELVSALRDASAVLTRIRDEYHYGTEDEGARYRHDVVLAELKRLIASAERRA